MQDVGIDMAKSRLHEYLSPLVFKSVVEKTVIGVEKEQQV